jgi:porphobilinogen deaminase
MLNKILPFDICMHAVSQGALGIECRLSDLEVIQMINKLNHEETLLRCIAERTFLARLEGGCSAPVGVVSKVTDRSISLEGVVLSICGTQRIYDKFEMKFNSSITHDCPIVAIMNDAEKQAFSLNENNQTSLILKHKRDEISDDEDNFEETKKTKTENNIAETSSASLSADLNLNMKHFSFIVDLNIEQNKMIKAELCGLHLAQKLKDKGADVIIRECKDQVNKTH